LSEIHRQTPIIQRITKGLEWQTAYIIVVELKQANDVLTFGLFRSKNYLTFQAVLCFIEQPQYPSFPRGVGLSDETLQKSFPFSKNFPSIGALLAGMGRFWETFRLVIARLQRRSFTVR